MTKRLFIICLSVIAALSFSCSSSDDGGGDTGGGKNPFDFEVSPSVGASNSYIDTYLDLTFKNVPSLGSSGVISVYRADGVLVDQINIADKVERLESGSLYNSSKIDFLGKDQRVRAVVYEPVSIDGKNVRIKLHSGVLDYNTEYYVVVDRNVVVSEDFQGISAGQWKFKTKAKPTGTSVTVSATGNTADFRTIQGALDYAVSLGATTPVVVDIKNGTYSELLFLRGKSNLTLKGESREGVIITFNNYDGLNGGVGGSATKASKGGKIAAGGGRSVMLIESSDMVRFENLTITNSHSKTGNGDQAETIYFNSSGRLIAVNCNFNSTQDTLCLKGHCWFYNCVVSGDVDFIWGGAQVALFEECEIRTIVDKRNGVAVPNQSSYILQARQENSSHKGFVFLNCEITRESGVPDNRIFLARSSGQSNYYDNIAFISCIMDNHISEQGWHTSPAPNPATANYRSGWKEYGSKNIKGEAMDVSKRASGSYTLTQTQYEAYYKDRETIFKDSDAGNGWMEI